MVTKTELVRQLTHLFFGLAAIAFIFTLNFYFPGTNWRILAMFSFTILLYAFLLVVHLRKTGMKIPFIEGILSQIGHRDRFPGEGTVWYVLGIIVLLTFLTDFFQIMASLFILAVGDSASTLFSSQNSITSTFKNKTPASFVAFVVFSLPAVLLLGPMALSLILFTAIIESIDFGINDNFLLPVACIAFFYLA